MTPLMKFELWELIIQKYKSKLGRPSVLHEPVNGQITHINTSNSPTAELCSVSCTLKIDNKLENTEWFRPKTLVIINFPGNYKRFGLTDKPFSRRDDFVIKKEFNIDIIVSDNEIVRGMKGKDVTVEVIQYINIELELFHVLDDIKNSSLLDKILDPNTNIDFNKDLSNVPEYIGFDKLNTDQAMILQIISRNVSERKKNVYLIEGPPGTGKTRLMANLVLQFIRNQEISKNLRILICAPNHKAVDVLAEKLIKMKLARPDLGFTLVRYGYDTKKMSEKVLPYTLNAQVDDILKKKVKKVVNSISPESVKHIELTELIQRKNQIQKENAENPSMLKVSRIELATIEQQIQKLEKDMYLLQYGNNALTTEKLKIKRHLIEKAEIVCCTLSSCVTLYNETKHFDICIIDEATQALEYTSVVPLKFGVDSLIMVGDTKQLQATVMSQEAKEFGLDDSLFGRIHHTVNKNQIRTMKLVRQYRMDPEIISFPNRQFYNNSIMTSETVKSGLEMNPLQPYLIFNLESQENYTQNPHSYNEAEVQFVLKLLRAIDRLAKIEVNATCIVTPYATQKDLFEKGMNPKERKYVTVSTIDALQGQERDIVIFSCVRTNGTGFLDNDQRLNVALTRAKKALYICGNFQSLSGLETWKSLLEDAEQRNFSIDGDDNIDQLCEKIKRRKK